MLIVFPVFWNFRLVDLSIAIRNGLGTMKYCCVSQSFSLVVLRQTFPFLFEKVWDKKDTITLMLSAIFILVAVFKGLIHSVFIHVGRDRVFPLLFLALLPVFYILLKGTCFICFLSDMNFVVHVLMLKIQVDIEAMTLPS